VLDLKLSNSWIYRLFLCEDANFRLKSKERSNDKHDPTLGPGFAYMVEKEGHLKHARKHANQAEISHCAGFEALSLVNGKKSKGLRATGVGSVSCARHELVRAGGVGDLQVGERYAPLLFLNNVFTS
jgi:hypothetical protein